MTDMTDMTDRAIVQLGPFLNKNGKRILLAPARARARGA